MRYLGGKYFTAKHIAQHVNGQNGTIFLEPFMGSCWVTAQIDYPHRIAGDIHKELVIMYYKAVYQGWIPPEHITKEEYDDIRANKTTDKYPPELIAFAAFGCTFGGSCWRKYAGDRIAASKRSILKKVQKLENVSFFVADYRDLRPCGCVIYCDPPYAGKYTYRITGVKGNGQFDHSEFWKIMDDWSQENMVFISELEAPEGYECLMSVTRKACVRTKEGCLERNEKLFCKNKHVILNQDQQIDPLRVLGRTGLDDFRFYQ